MCCLAIDARSAQPQVNTSLPPSTEPPGRGHSGLGRNQQHCRYDVNRLPRCPVNLLSTADTLVTAKPLLGRLIRSRFTRIPMRLRQQQEVRIWHDGDPEVGQSQFSFAPVVQSQTAQLFADCGRVAQFFLLTNRAVKILVSCELSELLISGARRCHRSCMVPLGRRTVLRRSR